jgi:hypothetical protein
MPDFSWDYLHTKTGKIYQITAKIPNGYKLFQIAVKLTYCPRNLPTPSIARPSKINPTYHLATLA